MGALREHPYLFFVIATLLPLASFVFMLLVGGVRNFVRARRKDASADAVYHAMGGDAPGKAPAYLGMAAIFLAFCCSAFGYVHFVLDHHHQEEAVEQAESAVRSAKSKLRG